LNWFGSQQHHAAHAAATETATAATTTLATALGHGVCGQSDQQQHASNSKNQSFLHGFAPHFVISQKSADPSAERQC
jgi:hypothetical protein